MPPRKRARVEESAELQHAKEQEQEQQEQQVLAQEDEGEDAFAAAHVDAVDREALYDTLAPPRGSNSKEEGGAAAASSSITSQDDISGQAFGDRFDASRFAYASPQPAGMKSTLFSYQRDAVGWLARRERGELLWTPRNSTEYPDPGDGSSPGASLSPERRAELEAQCRKVRGGLLADEMGLGKTLEVIGLVLTHKYSAEEAAAMRREVDDEADLPESVREMLQKGRAGLPAEVATEDNSLPDCRATLIVCPATLLAQWKNEIEKHAPETKLHVYLGMAKLRQMLRSAQNASGRPAARRAPRGKRAAAASSDADVFLPDGEESADEASSATGASSSDELARLFDTFDVVLTTYEVLRNEVFYVEDHGMSLRRTEVKYVKPKTPLIRTRFWRTILDEAQMVKAPTTQTARMGLYISTYYRWCVSGTPLHRGFVDMKGLLRFLRCESQWNQSTTRLLEFIRLIMLRRTKLGVENEIDIPSPQEQIELVPFSKMERFCYDKLVDDLTKQKRDAEEKERALAVKAQGISRARQLAEHSAEAKPIITEEPTDQDLLVAPASNAVELLDENSKATLKKFCSCPYIVVQKEIVLAGSSKKQKLDVQRNDVLQDMIDRGKTDFRRCQVELVEALNELAGAILHTSSLAADDEFCDPGSVEAAKEVYFKAFALAHQKPSKYFECFGRVSSGFAEVDTFFEWKDMDSSSAWRMAALHTLSNLAPLLSGESYILREKLLAQADALKFVALDQSLSSVRQELMALRVTKRRNSALRENRLREPESGGRWWHLALEWLGKADRHERTIRLARAAFEDRIQGMKDAFDVALAVWESNPAKSRGSKPKAPQLPKFPKAQVESLTGHTLEAFMGMVYHGSESRFNVAGSDMMLYVAFDENSDTISSSDELVAWIDAALGSWVDARKAAWNSLRTPLCFYRESMPQWQVEHENSAALVSGYESLLLGRGRKFVGTQHDGSRKVMNLDFGSKASPEERVLLLLHQRLVAELSNLDRLFLSAWVLRRDTWAAKDEIDWSAVPSDLVDKYERLAYLVELAVDHIFECSQLREDELASMNSAWDARDKYWRVLQDVENSLLTESVIEQLESAQARLGPVELDAASGSDTDDADVLLVDDDASDRAIGKSGAKFTEQARLSALSVFERRLRRAEGRCLFAKRDLEHLLKLNRAQAPETAAFGTKIEAVFKRIRKILETDPSAKVLVFSQFTESLGQLASLLYHSKPSIGFVSGKNVSGIPGVKMGTGTIASRLKTFKEDPHTSVCLLNSTAASAGLTLTVANHVVMMDPARTASDDKQAVGRAYRLGQKRHTFIWRFAMISSLEEDQTLNLAGAYERPETGNDDADSKMPDDSDDEAEDDE